MAAARVENDGGVDIVELSPVNENEAAGNGELVIERVVEAEEKRLEEQELVVENGVAVPPRMTSIAMVVPAELLFGLPAPRRSEGRGEG